MIMKKLWAGIACTFFSVYLFLLTLQVRSLVADLCCREYVLPCNWQPWKCLLFELMTLQRNNSEEVKSAEFTKLRHTAVKLLRGKFFSKSCLKQFDDIRHICDFSFLLEGVQKRRTIGFDVISQQSEIVKPKLKYQKDSRKNPSII